VRRLVAVSFLARVGEQTFAVAVVLYALHRLGSPSLAGLVAFLAFAPGLLVSPVAGVLLDRVGSARAMRVDLVASAVLLATLVAADRFSSRPVVVVAAVVALYSLTSPLQLAGVRALLPRLVADEALGAVNAIDAGSYAVADVVGPLVAGGLFAVAGGGTTLAVVALVYAAAAVLSGDLVRADGARPAGVAGDLFRGAAASVGYVLRHRTLRALAASYALYQVCWGVLLVAVPARLLAGSGRAATATALTGVLWAGVGLAAGVGAVLAGRLAVRGRERRLIVAGTAVTAVAVGSVPVLGGVSVPGGASVFGGVGGLAVALVVVGLASGPVDVGTLTLRQRRTDPAQLGRVLAVSISLNMSGLPVGAALGGAVVTWSVSGAFVVSGAAALAAALVMRVRESTVD
jgi:MFS family permease